jgi:hypothetical protein
MLDKFRQSNVCTYYTEFLKMARVCARARRRWDLYTEKYLLYRGNDLAIRLKVQSFVYVSINGRPYAIPVHH